MKLEGSSPYSQQPATGPYPEPNERDVGTDFDDVLNPRVRCLAAGTTKI
jgi:hypothetical protein